MPATPIATSVVPCRQARPNESLTITAGAVAEPGGERVAEAARRRVGVAREQHDPVVPGRVRAVDAGARADEAVLGLGDDESPRRRRTARASRRITSTWSAACSTRPSAFETTFWETTSDVALLQAAGPLERVAEERRRGRRPAAPPGSRRAGGRGSLGKPGDPHARVGLVAAVDVQEDGRERLEPARDLEAAAVDGPAFDQPLGEAGDELPSPRASSPASSTSSSSGTSGSASALRAHGVEAGDDARVGRAAAAISASESSPGAAPACPSRKTIGAATLTTILPASASRSSSRHVRDAARAGRRGRRRRSDGRPRRSRRTRRAACASR